MKLTLVSLLLVFVSNARAVSYNLMPTDTPALKGEYSVPVTKELEPYASYPLSEVCWYGDGHKVALGYTLPQELTGVKSDMIFLTGEDTGQDSFKLTGDHGDATCSRGDSLSIKCVVSYQNLTFDADGVKKTLQNEFSDPFEISQRLAVANHFGGEPIGVITFPDMISPFPASFRLP